MLFALFAAILALGSGHLRGYWQGEELADFCPANQTWPTYNKTAAIKPWYRSAEEKEEAVKLGRGRDL